MIPPYRLKVPAGVLDAENTLKVVVTNTAANWYVHTDHFDKWETCEVSSYLAGERKQAKEILLPAVCMVLCCCIRNDLRGDKRIINTKKPWNT
ncbi:MAG: hypothetical protein IJ325_04925 [Clostridia bacterium]|nr:hypothetical protein [Clostridia bacterium]